MDLSSPSPNTNSPLTSVFGDNVQDLLGTGTLNVNPTGIIVVNSIDDVVGEGNGVTTLRDAINQTNADSGEDLIVFERSLFSTAQTITLSFGELDLTHNLDIIAPRDTLTGGDLVTVSGNKASRVFEIESGAGVTVSGLIVADGSARGDDGGGIKNSGILTLDNSIVRNNFAFGSSITNFPLLPSSGGGGIFNNKNSTLRVIDSTISGNSVSGDFVSGGGGIYNNSGAVEVSYSTISGNSVSGIYDGVGGGIYNNSGAVEVSYSTISGNSVANPLFSGSGNTSGNGGGIYGSVTVNNSTISGNRATRNGGGICGSAVVVNNSTISSNSSSNGGGIYGSATVNNSTISGNKAITSYSVAGGGIFSTGNTTVMNSSISNNSATLSNTSIKDGYGEGGGIYNNNGTLKVINSTITGNSTATSGGGGGGINVASGTVMLLFDTITLNSGKVGSGIYISPNGSSSVSVRNTIIAANLPIESGINPDVSGTFTSNGYNLIGDSTGSTGFDETIGDLVGTSLNPIDPRLAPLDFNGGPTQTLALLPDSPAIDAADPTVLDTDPTTDQRGLPRVSNGRADIGAFEFS